MILSAYVNILLQGKEKRNTSLAFVRPTLSPSGEIIARISLVFVSVALLAEVATTKTMYFRL